MNSKRMSRISLVLLFVSYFVSLFININLIFSIIQRNFITLESTAKSLYVALLVLSIFIIIMSTLILILSINRSRKIGGSITMIFLLMTIFVMKDNFSPDGYTTTFDKETKPVNISGEIVNKKIHNDSEYYIEVKTKTELFPVKVIVKKNEYESLNENERFKSKVKLLMSFNGGEPIT